MLTKVYFFISLVVAVCGLVFASISFWQGILLFLMCFLVLLLLFVLVMVAAAVMADPSKPVEKVSRLSQSCCCGIGALLIDFGLLDVSVSGLEKLPKERRFLIVSNHCSAMDPMVMVQKLKKYEVAFVSKPSNMRIPVIGRMSYGAGYLPIDRENDRNALKTILCAANYLKKGLCSICIYPEGTRSRDGVLLPFHAGSFKIAQRAAAPVVIACSTGTDQVKHNIKRLRRSKVGLDILEVVPAERVTAMSSAELSEYSHELIRKHLEANQAKERVS